MESERESERESEIESARPLDGDGRPLDVLVVGGGVIGVACALELARRGAQVTVIDRDRLGAACSYGNAGWLTPSLAVPLPAPGVVAKALKWLLDADGPFYIQPRLDVELVSWLFRFWAATGRARFERGAEALVRLSRWSCDEWQKLAGRDGVDFGYARNGLVAIYEHADAFAAGRGHAEMVARFGVPFETWTADELREREPAVRGAQVGGYFFPDDAHCRPFQAFQALADEARRAGVRMIEGVDAYGVEREGGKVVRVLTTRGPIAAKEFVVAVGAWSKSFGRTIGLDIPMLGAKGYSLLTPRLDPHPTRSLLLAERKVAIVPHDDALRIAGTLELVDEDLSITRRRVEAIVRATRGLLPLADPLPIQELWRGLRPCLPDGLPAIGKARGAKNLWLATGHQMTGLKTAPGTGRLLAELMSGETPTFDPTPFRADRY
jgi:D-amino-acid dehydrogenase